MPRVRCALAMTSFFARSAMQNRAGRPGGRPLRKRNKACGKTGRCGERTERCRWQRKRSERVAAVKILSVRRKAAQKFWAPQQDHRPLRMFYSVCGGRGDMASLWQEEYSLRPIFLGIGDFSPEKGVAFFDRCGILPSVTQI